VTPKIRLTARSPDDWEWRPRLDPDRLRKVGYATLALLERNAQWVHRRVETLTLVDERVARRHISVDFTLPRRMPKSHAVAGQSVYFVPITFLWREPGPMRYDVRDEAGGALPLLNESEHSRIMASMLFQAAERRLQKFKLEPDWPLRVALVQLPFAIWPDSLPSLRALLNPASQEWEDFPGRSDLRERLREDPAFVNLLCLAAQRNVAVAPLVDCAGQRRVVKLAFEEKLVEQDRPDRPTTWVSRAKAGSGLWPTQAVIRMPMIGGASSQHVQVLTPPNVELTSATLAGADPADTLHELIFHPTAAARADRFAHTVIGPANRAHLYRPDAHDVQVGVVQVDLRAERRGMLTASLVATFLVFAALTALAWGMLDGTLAGRSSAASSLVLIAPGLIAAFLVRAGEHAMARRLLRPSRLLLACCALTTFVAAVLLVLMGPESSDLIELEMKGATATGTIDGADPATSLGLQISLVVLAIFGLLLFVGMLACYCRPTVPDAAVSPDRP
jgi:hypothetical protein